MTDQEATPTKGTRRVTWMQVKKADYERLLEVERAAKDLADEMDRTRARAWNRGTPVVPTDIVAGWAASLRRLVEPNKASGT